MARHGIARAHARAPPLLAFLAAWAAAGSGWEVILWLDGLAAGGESPGAGTGRPGPQLAPAHWETMGPSGPLHSLGAQFETTGTEEGGHEGEEVAYLGTHTLTRPASEDAYTSPSTHR